MRLLVALAVLLTLTGCGRERPLPVNHLASSETVLASAQHWQILASDVADRLVAVQPQAEMIAIDLPEETSSFGTNFREMLITELFKRGYDIADEAPYHVQFDWHLVKHPQMDSIEKKSFEAIGAGAGLYGVYRLVTDTLAPTVGIALGGIAAGSFIAGSWIADDVNSEVVITATVRQGPHIVHRQTDVYYLQDGEMENFREAGEKKSTITLAQDKAERTGVSDVTAKANQYCQKQDARAVLTRRYVGANDVRYNDFSCVKMADLN